MQIINVNLTRKYNYPIIIGTNFTKLVNELVGLVNFDNFSKILLITNKTLLNLYFKQIELNLNIVCKKQLHNHIIDDIEEHKKIDTVYLILKYLLKNKYGRDTLLLSLGGGIIGDICGFVASIYYRGICHIYIPTTLLAQVDASIGGKTGVNSIYGKNIIGTFYQPSAVIINIIYLYSLSSNDFNNGLAEVVKYAIAFDNKFYTWLNQHILSILNMDKNNLIYCISRCCRLKREIIQNDELEKYDQRILLNLGHTYAHALETYFNYNKFTHGQAVSIGIILSMYTSHIMGFINKQHIKQVINFLELIDLPVKLPQNLDVKKYYNIMMHDKKINNGKLSLIIPKEIGLSKIYRNISLELIINTLKYALQN